MSGRLTVGMLAELVANQKLDESTEIVVLDAAGDEISLPDAVSFEVDEAGDDPQIYFNLGWDTKEPTRLTLDSQLDDDEDDNYKAGKNAEFILSVPADIVHLVKIRASN